MNLDAIFSQAINQYVASMEAQLMRDAIRSVAPNAPDQLVDLAAQSDGRQQQDLVQALVIGEVLRLL